MSSLLEREHSLAALMASLQTASGGNGLTVLLSGEAGIGKTALLEHFVRALPIGRVLWGGCEALSTPHPLGPVYDIVRDAGAKLRSALSAAGIERVALFSAVLDELANPPAPVVLIVEDVHWADAATLDLVTYLGRRIHRSAALMILSYRDDEASFAALRQTIASIPAARAIRIGLERLSRSAVDGMAEAAGRDGGALYAATGGNPFFVTEVLQSGGPGSVPATVRDAILARAAQLGPRAFAVLELASIVPRAVELALINDVSATLPADIEQCVSSGLLIAEGNTLRFRHELGRVAILEAISPPRAMQLHANVLTAFSARSAQTVASATLMHHAVQAGDARAVQRIAPLAAREAALRGARREAAAHCRSALLYADGLSAAVRAGLLDDYATHCFELNDLDAAISAREEAIALFAATADVARESEALANHAMSLVRALRNADADIAAQRAISLAERLGPGHALAKAYATQSYLRMLNRDCREAIGWGEKAIELSKEFDDARILAGAYLTVGAAWMFVDYPRGCHYVSRSLEIAQGLADGGVGVADAYMMLGTASGEVYAYANATRYLSEGITFARSRDLDRVTGYMMGWQALCDVYQGRWDLAGQRASEVASREAGSTTNRVIALIALGRLRTRRGDPGVSEVLDEALALAFRSGTLQRLGPVCVARAEAAWLNRNAAQTQAEAERAFDLAASKGHPWLLGELAFWLWRAGRIADAPPGCATPYALQIAGSWREAAAWWAGLGCPYEQARALADGDEESRREALVILDRLGARPLADRVREDMRAAGIRSVPRGPSAATRDNAAGLTARESEVLALVAEGWRNAQIAARLARSSRTVDHHVEAILAKLGATTRGEAVETAHRLGLLPNTG